MLIEHFIHSFVALFVIIDPIGIAPIFASIVNASYGRSATKIALRATVVATSIMLCFGIFGQAILTQLGISIEAFKIAGGALLFVTGFQMLMSPSEQIKYAEASTADTDTTHDVAVFPIGIPLLAGPGCITTLILLMAHSHGEITNKVLTIVALICVNICAFACMLFAKRISHYIGRTGTNVFGRVLGLILTALSVQYIVDGIKVFFHI